MNITTENPVLTRILVADPCFQAAELYVKESDGHKYKIGEIRTLSGLLQFPEHNGEQVKITAIRKDGSRGKAYYIEGKIPLNWVFEDRLV